MLSKRYESFEVNRRIWLHVPSGTPRSTSSDTHQVVEIKTTLHRRIRCAGDSIRIIIKTNLINLRSLTNT